MTGLTRISRRYSATPGTELRLRVVRRTVVTAMSAVLLIACRGEGDDTQTDTVRDAVPPANSIYGDTSSLTDAGILARFDRANVTDSAAGVIAASKATSSDLRSFAAQMVRDHHLMRVEGERVARRLRLTPEDVAGTGGEAGMGAILAVLNSTERGRDFDKAYIDHEVAFHLDFLETVTGAMELAGETEVRAFIQKLAPMLEEHLDIAQELQARLR